MSSLSGLHAEASQLVPKNNDEQESMFMAQLIDESGFAKNILNSPEEDCWNDL
jgi:hypothetical protein